MIDLKTIPTIEAAHYTRTNGRELDLIVIHTMEAPEKPDTAENVARWFAGPTAPQASAHYCIDANSIVRGVLDKHVAWHAPGANHNGIGLEHAGYARQTEGEWNDPFSKQMLARSAELAAALMKQYQIPIVWLSALELIAGKRGITSHANVSEAFKRSSHWDPGAHFPHGRYLFLIRSALARDTIDDAQPVKRPPPTLRKGDKGWRVKQAQRLLRSAHQRIDASGNFDLWTERATKAFQRHARLEPDGVIGPQTWTALWQHKYFGHAEAAALWRAERP